MIFANRRYILATRDIDRHCQIHGAVFRQWEEPLRPQLDLQSHALNFPSLFQSSMSRVKPFLSSSAPGRKRGTIFRRGAVSTCSGIIFIFLIFDIFKLFQKFNIARCRYILSIENFSLMQIPLLIAHYICIIKFFLSLI